VPDRTVYLIDELRLDGDRVACRYAVAFVTSASCGSEWHAIVYDPVSAIRQAPSEPMRFSAISRDGARLSGRVIAGNAETSVGAEYLTGVGPMSVRGQDRKPVVLGPADVAARELAASTYIAGRLYPRELPSLSKEVEKPPARIVGRIARDLAHRTGGRRSASRR
jgi:hypothetical protein